MVELIKSVIANVLQSVYQPFWFALILSVFFMFLWKQYSNIKTAVRLWVSWFKEEESFRAMFFLTFYTVMILFRTLLNRSMWANPISNVIGYFWIYTEDGSLTTECFENLVLFIPFVILLLYNYQEKLLGKKPTIAHTLWQSTKIIFIFSFAIEMLQLFLRLGTWQLSDLFYNTLGGFIGGLIYWCGYKITHRKKKDKDITDTP